LYAGHEYTASNADFALRMEPENAALKERVAEVKRLRADGKPTLPTRVDLEKATNPFMRTDSAEIRATLNMTDASAVDVFSELRERKNQG
ncbi:MAG: hydroxyacylglutathione hydrolase C-terminal domain-containing protein, partial [Pseudomonadota bacterium]